MNKDIPKKYTCDYLCYVLCACVSGSGDRYQRPEFWVALCIQAFAILLI